MTEWRKIQVSIPDPEALASAQLYKRISDDIWRKKSSGSKDSVVATVESVLESSEARDAINDVVRPIDSRLVVSGIDKALHLGGMWPSQKAKLSPKFLSRPLAAEVSTTNWDSRYGKRRDVEVNGQHLIAKFVDRHTDYSRELFARLYFGDEDSVKAFLEYSIQRNQAAQGSLTELWLTAWHYTLADTGYEGNRLHHVGLTEEQEISVLKLFQSIGGITLEESAQA